MSITNKEHSDLTSVHRVGYMQPSDPGAVGYGKMWIDTSENPARIRLRNDSNTGWVDTSISFFELQERIEELEDIVNGMTPPTVAPANVDDVTGTLSGNSVRWTWDRVNDEFVAGYNIYRGTTLINFVNGTEFIEPVAESLALTVKTLGTNGMESTGTTGFFTLDTPTAPSGYDLVFTGNSIIHNWTVVPGITYEIAADDDGTDILVTNLSTSGWEELNFSTASRVIERWIRAIRHGVPSTWVAGTETVTAPVAPVILVDDVVGNNFQVSVKITTTDDLSKIKYTIIQTRKQGDAWAADDNPSTDGVTRLNGAVTEATLVGVQGETWEIRVKYVDVFGAGAWSNVITHEFPLVQINTGTLAYQTAGTLDPIRSGGGTITHTAGGLIQWSAAVNVFGLSDLISTTGDINIDANPTGTSLPADSILVARWDINTQDYTLEVFPLNTYTYPDTATTELVDYELARRIGGNMVWFDGRVIPSGLSIDANTYIPRSSTNVAYIGSATIDGATITTGTITWLQVSEFETASYVPDENGFKISDDVFEVNGNLRTLGMDLDETALRALIGLDATGAYRGRDVGRVPTGRIVPYVDSSVVQEADTVLAIIACDVTGNKSDRNAESDTISLSKVEVYNKFDELVKVMPIQSYLGNGVAGMTSHSRTYADPLEEAIYKITIRNYYGYSNPVYMKGSYYGITKPTALLRSQCPLNANASAIDATSVAISYQFSANVHVHYRKVGVATWTVHTSNVSSSPFTAGGLTENTNYEFRLVSVANALNTSNITRACTKQQGTAAPLRPAPSGITGAPTSGSPTSSLTFNWVRNAVDNTDVEVFVDGALAATVGATVVTYSITGLPEGATRSVKVRNKWGVGDYSTFSDIAVATTNVTPPATSPPTIDNAYYIYTGGSPYDDYVQIEFTPHGGSGTFTAEWRPEGSGTYETILPTISAGATDAQYYLVLRTNYPQTFYLRMRRNDVSGNSNEVTVVIPPWDNTGTGGGGDGGSDGGGGGVGGGGCFTYDTPVWSAYGIREYLFMIQMFLFGYIMFPSLIQRAIGDIEEGEYIYAPDQNGKLRKKKVLKKFIHDVDGYVEASFTDEDIQTTNEHPFRKEDGTFAPMRDITQGTMLRCTDGKNTSLCLLEEKTEMVYNTKVYNIHVDDLNTYVVGKGKEVHNLKPPPDL